MNDGTLACTSCRRYVKAELIETRLIKLPSGGVVTKRYCVKCAESRTRALQAIQERQERCG